MVATWLRPFFVCAQYTRWMYFSLRSKVYEIRDTVDVNAHIDNFSRKKKRILSM